MRGLGVVGGGVVLEEAGEGGGVGGCEVGEEALVGGGGGGVHCWGGGSEGSGEGRFGVDGVEEGFEGRDGLCVGFLGDVGSWGDKLTNRKVELGMWSVRALQGWTSVVNLDFFPLPLLPLLWYSAHAIHRGKYDLKQYNGCKSESSLWHALLPQLLRKDTGLKTMNSGTLSFPVTASRCCIPALTYFMVVDV